MRALIWPPLNPPRDGSKVVVASRALTCTSRGSVPPKVRPLRLMLFWSEPRPSTEKPIVPSALAIAVTPGRKAAIWERSPSAPTGMPCEFNCCSTPPMSGRFSSPTVGRARAVTRTASSCVGADSILPLARITASSSFTFCTSKLSGTIPIAVNVTI